MRYLSRALEPDFWARYRKRHPKATYDSLQDTSEGREIREQLHEFLSDQQNGFCAYCCDSLQDNKGRRQSLTEHIKPRHGQGNAYAAFSMDYDNMVASCKDRGHCDDSKDGEYDETLFVSPLDAACNEHFACRPNGKMAGKTDAGTYTIDLLNLNHPALVRGRCSTWKSCESLCEDAEVAEVLATYVGDAGEALLPFADAAEACCALYKN